MDNKDYVTDNIIVNGDACKPIVTLFVEHSNNLKLKSNISLFCCLYGVQYRYNNSIYKDS